MTSGRDLQHGRYEVRFGFQDVPPPVDVSAAPSTCCTSRRGISGAAIGRGKRNSSNGGAAAGIAGPTREELPEVLAYQASPPSSARASERT